MEQLPAFQYICSDTVGLSQNEKSRMVTMNIAEVPLVLQGTTLKAKIITDVFGTFWYSQKGQVSNFRNIYCFLIENHILRQP